MNRDFRSAKKGDRVVILIDPDEAVPQFISEEDIEEYLRDGSLKDGDFILEIEVIRKRVVKTELQVVEDDESDAS